MKTKQIILAATLGLMIPLMSMGQTTLGPGVTGSSLTVAGLPHNFSTESWNPYVDIGHGAQICQPCHTPHNAQTGVWPTAPLWNHQLSSGPYTLYSSIKTSAGTMGVTAPDGTSQLCLSCHDGSIALGAFGGQNFGGTMAAYNGGLASFGTDLSNDHPISVDYNACRTVYNAGGLRNETTYQYSTYDYTTTTWTTTTKYTSSLLKSGKVQCTSCHGAHSNSRGYQLSMINTGSQLCLACHSK